MNNLGRVIFVSASAVVGGVAGYLLADLLIYKLISEDLDEEFEEEFEEESNEVVIESELNLIKLSNLSRKAPLQDLVRDYKPKAVNIIVGHEEVLRSKLDYEYEQVSYYEKDNVFANDDEEVIPDPASLLGVDLTLPWGVGSDDPDTIYIRDDDREVFFQVTRYHGSYDSLVLGMPEVEEKPKRSRKKKTDEDLDDGSLGE